MTTNHTPGPWNFRPVPADSQDGRFSYWIDKGAAPLADVRTRPNNEHEANARIMHAAPELLEALELMFRKFYGVADSKSEFAACEKARQAINKARVG